VAVRLQGEGFSTPIINAAVPSYSLNQAVYRYIYEIQNIFPVSVIVLQAYDPAGNFLLGRSGMGRDKELVYYKRIQSYDVPPSILYIDSIAASILVLYRIRMGKIFQDVYCHLTDMELDLEASAVAVYVRSCTRPH